MMESLKKTKEFIQKAIKVHGDRFDYSEVVYISAKRKVKIICTTHGSFFQSPDSHLRGSACPKCSGKNWSNEDFTKKATEIHKNRYDYSKTLFLNKSTPVQIICRTHGIFKQLPSVHLNGSGCPKCAGKQFSFSEIIDLARAIHGKKYQYLDYAIEKDHSGKYRNFITIKCKIHNFTWKATTYSHIKKGTGCNICGNEQISASQRTTIEDIKAAIEKLHPNYVVPIEQKYTNQHTDISYICHLHGKQRGRPINLLNGQGCPVCGQEKRNDFFRDDWYSVVERIEEKFPEYYVYRDQRFENHHSPIVYKCNHHGDKITTANALLSKGVGCDECGNIKRAESQKSNWLDVVKKIESIHNNLEVSRNQEYKNTNSHITYICSKHGQQRAMPSKLLQGRGCPKCAIESRNNYSDSAWCKLCGERGAKLYWLKMEYEDERWYKFGKTFQKIKDRWWELNKVGIKYEIVRVIIGDPAYICKLERRILRFYKSRHYTPPIQFGGHLTECISIQ